MIMPILAHMEMIQPYAIRSKFDPANKGGNPNVDYSMTNPLEQSGTNFACKGYQNDRPIRTVASYKAGSTQKLKLTGSATHNGGSCQISLSYDNGKTFKVIKSIIGGCPLTKEYDFKVPEYVPGGTALLSWSWQNLVGNREFYQNCAWVDIQGGTKVSGQQRRHVELEHRQSGYSSFGDLPNIWKTNLPTVNQCKTLEGQAPNYPHTGPDVQYAGNGMSSSSPKTPGTCDEAGPDPPTYKPLPMTGVQPEPASSTNDGSEGESSLQPPPPPPLPSSSGYAQPPASPTPASQPSPSPPPSPSPQSSAGTAPSQSGSSSGSSSGSGGSGGAGGGNGGPTPYSQFLPCEAGKFLCTSAHSFATCVDGNRFVDMGAVEAGMICKPTGRNTGEIVLPP